MTIILEDEIRDRLPTQRLERVVGQNAGSLSGIRIYKTDREDLSLFVKINDRSDASIMFDGELESLRHINLTQAIRAPKELFTIHNYDNKGSSAIVVEYLNIEPLDDKTGEELGRNLADLHSYNHKVIKFSERASKWIGKGPPSVKALLGSSDSHDDDESTREGEEEPISFAKHSMKVRNDKESGGVKCTDRFAPNPGVNPTEVFGFDVPTSCGVLPQINEWNPDWVSFFARYRLEAPINAILSDHGDRELMQQWSHLQLKLEKFFTDYDLKPNADAKDGIIPSLLHGDLWSQNAARIKNENDEWDPVVFDPSAFYGHSEYDFGIARMFRGFPASFERAYFERMPKKRLFEKRGVLYQLFHHLNHWRQFGYGYRSSSLRLITDLNKEA